jgi:hypothetical protein
MGSCYKVMNWRWAVAVNKAALVSLFDSGDPLRKRIGGIQQGWCIMRSRNSRISFWRGFQCAFPSGDFLTLTCQVCCAVCACLGSRARQAAMAGAIAPDLSPYNALSECVFLGPLRPVTRPQCGSGRPCERPPSLRRPFKRVREREQEQEPRMLPTHSCLNKASQ